MTSKNVYRAEIGKGHFWMVLRTSPLQTLKSVRMIFFSHEFRNIVIPSTLSDHINKASHKISTKKKSRFEHRTTKTSIAR